MKTNPQQMRSEASQREGEQGYMLLGLIVAIAIILLMLSVAAADMAHTVRVERERESARRAQQYVRAIRLFYKKTQNYPPSMKALDNTNLVRYLRQEYKDPLTGKEYRLIGVGQNKTTVKGFFGQPLGGIAGAGLGSAAGMQSTGGGLAGPTNGTGLGGTTAGPNGTTGTNGATTGAGGTAGTSGFSSNPFTTGPMGSLATSGSMGPFMGVGSNAKGDSILIVNEQTTYETWEFLYDPRIEKLYAAAALNGGAGTGTLGSGGSGFNSTGFSPSGNTPNSSGFNPTNPNGQTNGSSGGATPPGGTSPTGP
jgi:type II secretory pathway pseudopilin PulG